jgi:hypothetical protein
MKLEIVDDLRRRFGDADYDQVQSILKQHGRQYERADIEVALRATSLAPGATDIGFLQRFIKYYLTWKELEAAFWSAPIDTPMSSQKFGHSVRDALGAVRDHHLELDRSSWYADSNLGEAS